MQRFFGLFRPWIFCLAAAVLTAAGGCVRYTKPIAPAKPAKLSVADRNYDAVWQAAIKVLRGRYYFRINRRDRRAGVITTYPLVGKQFFEFWRRDAVGGQDVAESSLHTIYRTVLVNVRPTRRDSAIYEPIVRVRAVRSNKEQLTMGSTGQAYDMFIHPGETLDVARKIGRRGSDAPGPDDERLEAFKGLARRIAADIRAAAVQSSPRPRSQPAVETP